MKTLDQANPFVIFLYFAFVTGIVMFIPYPPLMIISLFGAVVYNITLKGGRDKSFHIFVWILFFVLTLANPLVSHKGNTVLLIINDRRITLESLLYGVNSSLMIVSMLYWFSCLTEIMTGDKLIYLTSFLSKRLSLVISMSVRFVPLFARQTKKVRDTQMAMGLYNDDSITDDIKSSMRVFSVIITWALENGITTADSMEARGFSLGKRSCYRIARFTKYDGTVILVSLALFLTVVISSLNGALKASFYPSLKIENSGLLTYTGLLCFCILTLLPSVINAEVSLRWKYLRSRV